MLDHNDRVFARQRHQQLGGTLDLLRSHAGHRLIHQQQLWILQQQHADLEPLFLTVRERAGAVVAPSLSDSRSMVWPNQAEPESGRVFARTSGEALEHRADHSARSGGRRRRRRVVSRPTTPRGRNSVTSTNKAPSARADDGAAQEITTAERQHRHQEQRHAGVSP